MFVLFSILWIIYTLIKFFFYFLKVFLTFWNYKVSLIQDMILCYIRNNQFYKLRISEKYMLRNLCFRIKVVNDVLQTLDVKSKDSFFITLNSSFENLFLTFNLRELFSLKSIGYRHYSKNLGSLLSFSYAFGYYGILFFYR